MNRFYRQFFILSLWFYLLLSVVGAIFSSLHGAPHLLCTFYANDAKTLMVFFGVGELACELLSLDYQALSQVERSQTGDYHDTHNKL